MRQWFFDKIETFKPEVGFETEFTIEVEDAIFPHIWKITEVEPQKKITYDWKYRGYDGAALVTFELSEQDGGTNLKLTHKVVETFQEDIPEFKREAGIGGWTYFITQSLPKYLVSAE